MAQRRPPFWIVMKAHLKADPRKTIALLALLVVAGLVYARLFLKSGPAEASADVNATSGVLPTADTATTTVPPAVQVRTRVRLNRPLVRELERNPFAILFLQHQTVQSDARDKPGMDENVDAREAASQLLLQSTVMGDEPLASISGQVVRAGDWIEGFRVEQIEARTVILRRDDLRIRLNLR